MRAVNASGAAITDVNLWYKTIGNRPENAGEEIEVTAVSSVFLQGEEFTHVIHTAEADLSEGFFHLDFTDARGQSWMKPLSSPLNLKGSAR